MIKVYKQHREKIFLFFSVLLGLIPLIWMLTGDFIAGEEFYAVDYAEWGRIFSHTWASRINFGEYSILTPFRLQGLILEAFSFLGLSLKSSFLVWQIGLSVLGSVSFFLLARKLFPDTSPEIRFISTIYYSLNPFFLNISLLLSPPRIVFAVLPLVCLIVADYLSKKSSSNPQLYKLLVITFFVSPIFVNLPMGAAFLMFIYGVIVYKGIFVLGKFSNLFKDLALFTVFLLITNMWWILPVAQKTSIKSAEIKQRTGAFVTIDKTKTVDAITGAGSWAYREKAGDLYYFPHSKNFDEFPLLVLKYIPFALILVTLFSLINEPKKRSSMTLFLFLSYLIFLLLSTGTSGFGGGLFKYAFENIPGFWIFREPYAKFMPFAVAMGALLIIPGIDYVENKLAQLDISFKHIRPTLKLFLIAAFFGLAFPYFNKGFLGIENRGYVRASRVIMPDYWTELIDDWVPKDGYYILYPSVALNDLYEWPSGYTGNPFLMFTNAKLINPQGGAAIYNTSLSTIFYQLLLNDPKELVEISKKYNLAGIIFQGDTVYEESKLNRERVKELYSDYMSYSNSKIDVYDFDSKNWEVELIQEGNLLGIDANPDELKKVIEYFNSDKKHIVQPSSSFPEDYIVAVSGGFSFKENTRLSNYELPELEPGTYKTLLLESSSTLTELKVDGGNITYFESAAADYANITYGDSCCQTLSTFNQIGDDIVEKEVWITADVDDAEAVTYKNTAENKLVLNYSSEPFFKKLSDIDLSSEYALTLNITSTENMRVNMFIVQVDSTTEISERIFEQQLKDTSGTGFLDFSQLDSISDAINPEYFVVMSPVLPTNANIFSNEQVVVEEFSMRLSNRPLVLVQTEAGATKEFLEETVPDSPGDIYEYIRKNDSLALVGVRSDRNSDLFLQFKNSYDPNWRLLTITKEEFETLNQDLSIKRFFVMLRLFIKSINQGKEPLNLEAYSNAWDVSFPKGDSHYLILFLPKYISDSLFVIGIAVLVLMIKGIFIRGETK